VCSEKLKEQNKLVEKQCREGWRGKKLKLSKKNVYYMLEHREVYAMAYINY